MFHNPPNTPETAENPEVSCPVSPPFPDSRNTCLARRVFPPAIAQEVLKSKPDNLVESTRKPDDEQEFGKVFEHAVLNFTHFAKWADDTAPPKDYSAVGCFVRSMAVICGNNAPKVDVFIPILVDKSAHLRPEAMTGILVQFKRRKVKGAMGPYAMDEKDVGLFKPVPTFASESKQAPLNPYITLVMEFGVPDLPLTDTIAAAADATSSSRRPAPRAVVVVGQSLGRAGLRVHKAQHPRYSITAYGCSCSVYQVIKKEESHVYEHILRKGDPLQNHPRQDGRSLDLVRMQKPVFSTNNVSWDWITKDDRD